MKNLLVYKNMNLLNDSAVFQHLMDTLKESIFTWDYFVDFKKSISNAKRMKPELDKLNVLVGLKDEAFDTKFISLISMNPNLRKTLPILVALRSDKLSTTEIIDDISTMLSQSKAYLFNTKITLTSDIGNELINFVRKSGIYNLLNSGITSLYDYCIGVEVGMDTNARKNRTGTSMENLVEDIVAKFCDKNSFEYISQATQSSILSKWKYNITLDKISRRFDFAIKTKNGLYLLEVNYYSGGGSKLKATAGEYKELQNLLKPQGIDFIWVTDGLGWNTARTALNETFEHNDYVFNLEFLKNGVLEEIIR